MAALIFTYVFWKIRVLSVAANFIRIKRNGISEEQSFSVSSRSCRGTSKTVWFYILSGATIPIRFSAL